MSLNYSVLEINSNTTHDNAIDIYNVDCSNNSVTLTLDACWEGKGVRVKRIDSNGSNSCTVDGDTLNIDNASTKSLVPGQSVLLVRDATKWRTY